MAANKTGKGAGAMFTPLKVEESMSIRVANQLREMIVTAQISLGEQLSENTIAQALGVSRTPVREAFKILEAEKMVCVRPQRGSFVFTCDAIEAREICELRHILETGALRLACESNRTTLIDKLGNIAARSSAALNVDLQAYQAFDIEFHNAIFKVAENANLTEAYQRISGRVSSLRWRLTDTFHQNQNSHRDHIGLVKLLQNDQVSEAEKLLRQHINQTAEVIDAMFLENEQDPRLGVITGVQG